MSDAERVQELEDFCRQILRVHAETPQAEWIVRLAHELVPDEPCADYGQDHGQ